MFKRSKGSSVLGLWMVVMMVFSLFTATHVSAQPAGPTITVTQGEGGTITPGTVTITPLTNKKFTITPNAYYHITDVTVDAVSVYANLTWNTTNKKIAYYRFIAVDADHEITATYGLDTRKLTVSKAATGTGTVTDDLAQLDCGDDCVGDYEYDVKGATWPSVALTATADKGSRFQGWFDAAGALLSNASPYTTKMSKNKKITAKFIKTYALTTSTDGEGTGTVTTALVSGKSFGGGVYRLGSVVAVTAKPDFGMNFTGWSGDATGTTKKVNITMNADKSVNATFTVAGASKIASKVSVVDAKSGLTSPKPGMQALRIGRLTGVLWPPPGSDYELDQTNVYVEERSAEAFKTINEILCKIDQAKYAEMLNQGDYKAQIDNNLCSSGKDSASDAGQQSQNQSSGANMPDYELWTLNSSRDNDSSPHIVKAWIHKKGGDYEPDTLIYAKVEITEGASEENPFGLFTINFKASPIHPETGQVLNSFKLFYGFLKTELDPVTGKVLLKFTDKFEIPTVIAEQYGLDAQTSIEKATLDKKADGGTGKGTVYTYDKSPWTPPTGKSETLNFAFDTDYFHRQEVGNPEDMCLDRNNFAETVWSYGLYDSLAGARINRNSGFSIKKTQGDKDYYGWIGYWGIWFPEKVTVNDGDEVYKITYGPGGSEDLYNIFKSGGKLKKHVKQTLTLGEITNIPLDYMDGGTNYRVKWYDPDGDGTEPKGFYKVEQLNFDNYMWDKLPSPVLIDLTNLNYNVLNFWSRALNGNVQIKPDFEWVTDHFECAADDSTVVNFYTDELVYPDDVVPGTLVCFNNCPDAGILNNQNPFNDYSNPEYGVVPEASTHSEYTFDSARLVLVDGDTDVVTTTPAENFQWGLMSGPLFDPAYLNNLACDLDGDLVNESTCGWLGWSELAEYYTWETGPNDWNQFTALENPPPPDGDGSIVPFEPPLLVSYTHTWEDFTQSTFYLEYSGFGNLQGIPGKCVDKDAGQEMPCGSESRWLPQFNIPSDTQVTDAADGTIYRVKQLEKEQRMAEAADPASCAELTLKPYTLPDLADWVDPNIGDEPVLEGPPAVIGGVLQ